MNLTPRENLHRLLDGDAPDWVPYSIDVGAIPGFTEPIQRRFAALTGREDPAEHFDTDWRLFSLKCRFGGDDPAAWHGSVEAGTWFDEWGIGHWAGGLEGTLEQHYPPLASATTIREIEALPTPVILTEADSHSDSRTGTPARRSRTDGQECPSYDTRVTDEGSTGSDRSPVERFHATGYPVFGYGGSIYEWAWWLRGMQQFMLDLVSDTALAEAVVRKVEEHTTRLALATAAAGIDVLCFYDDAGMQRGMQIAPDLWRRHVKPAWQRVLDTVRAKFPAVRLFLHCCGKIEPIVPDIVDLGFHVLHPIQPECMDFDAAYREFGSRITLAATISAQRTFPFGSPDDVRAEVHRLAQLVAGDRRAILMPSNRIQPETPWENVLAFAAACRQVRDGVQPPTGGADQGFAPRIAGPEHG